MKASISGLITLISSHYLRFGFNLIGEFAFEVIAMTGNEHSEF